MKFTAIDYSKWSRREYFEHFRDTAVYMTVQVDITNLYNEIKRRGLRIYPALVYCAAKIINEDPEFCYGLDDEKRLGVWDVIHPYYTVPRIDNRELFSIKCTRYIPDFKGFYEAFSQDYAIAESCGRLFCDDTLPPNACGVSCTPGIPFSGFSFSGDKKEDFSPFVLLGKFALDGGRVNMPMSGEFSHAVNDGAHISRFFQEFERAANILLG